LTIRRESRFFVNDRPYPRYRGDTLLAGLRHLLLGYLGLDATW
jgi:hypothetical protein